MSWDDFYREFRCESCHEVADPAVLTDAGSMCEACSRPVPIARYLIRAVHTALCDDATVLRDSGTLPDGTWDDDDSTAALHARHDALLALAEHLDQALARSDAQPAAHTPMIPRETP
jgi:hypothetical protein